MRERLDRLWAAFLDLQARRMSRRFRRLALVAVLFTVLCYCGMSIFWLFPWHARRHLYQNPLYGMISGIWALQALGMAWFYIRLLRRFCSAPNWNDLAQMDFGKDYSQLSRMHKFDVRVRVKRAVHQGGGLEDERDALLQGDAERRAFRILKMVLPYFVAAYWVVCLCLPVGLVRVGLLMGGLVLSGMVIAVIVLPDVIRLWTEPDEVMVGPRVVDGVEA